MENLYEILEVSKNASNEIIKKAYKTLVKKYHPDLQEDGNKIFAEEKIKKINYAYDILSNDVKRADYDRKLADYELSINNNVNEKCEQYNNNVNEKCEQYNNNINDEKVYYDNKKNYSEEYDWQEDFLRLTRKEQKKLIRKYANQMNEEYSKIYRDTLRSLGFKIKHKWTLKDVFKILVFFATIIAVIYLLWLIPFTKEMLLNIYNNNEIIKLIVDVIVGTFKSAINV